MKRILNNIKKILPSKSKKVDKLSIDKIRNVKREKLNKGAVVTEEKTGLIYLFDGEKLKVSGVKKVNKNTIQIRKSPYLKS